MTQKSITVSILAISLAFTISCGKKEPVKVYKTVAVDSVLVENPGEKKPVNVTNGKVKRGEYVIVNEEKDANGKKFINVTIEGVATRGWIDAANLKDGRIVSVTVIRDDDLYTRPNIKSDKTGTVKAGQVAFKLEESGEFILIQFPGKEAYILKTSTGDAGMVVKTIVIPGLGKATISASSQFLSSEGKETQYDPRNIFDGKLETAWCEGKNNDDGVGEYILLNFEQPVEIYSISVVNGYAASEDTYKNNNRVASLKIAQTAVTEEFRYQDVSVDFDDNNMEYQHAYVNLYGRSFKFIINGVHKGKVSDTCISEIRIEGGQYVPEGGGY